MILAVAAAAQDEKTADPESPPQDEQSGEPTVVEPLIFLPSVSVGWSDWNLSGNENKFRQYATPPKGLFLGQLRYAPSFSRSSIDGLIDLRTPGQDDYRLTGGLRLLFGSTRIEASDSRSRFMNADPAATAVGERRITEGSIRQMLGRNFSIQFRSSVDTKEYPYSPPNGMLDQRMRHWSLEARGAVGANGYATVNYADGRNWDRTNVMLDSNTQRFNASYRHDLADNFSVEGTFARSHIKFTGATNKVETWGLGATLEPSETSTLFLNYRRDVYDLPIVHNAYAKFRETVRGRYVQRFGNWTGELGYKGQQIERVRGTRDFVDLLKWYTFDATVRGRLSPSVTLTARGVRDTLENGAGMVTTDGRALYWRNRSKAEVRLEAATEQMNGYAVFGLHENKNDVRQTRVLNQTLTLGAAFQAQPGLELYVEGTRDMWSGSSGDVVVPTIDSQLPDSTTFVLGANWNLTPNAYATLNYTEFLTNNDNPLSLADGNVRGRFFTGSFRYKAHKNLEFDLTYAPWTYTDRLAWPMDYRSNTLSMSAIVKF